MMTAVRRVGFLILVMAGVLLLTRVRLHRAQALHGNSHTKSHASAATEPTVTAKMARLPMAFEANAGQWDRSVRFRARQGGATLFITDRGMTLGLRDVNLPRKPGETPGEERAAREKAQKDAKAAAVSIQLVGANPHSPRGEKEIVTKSNFFLGSNPTLWRTNVPNYAQVRAKNWLPGVDVVWHGGVNGLEYDLEVAAGIDARAIALEVQGADSLRVDERGALEIATAAGTLVQQPPRVWQNEHELVVRYRTDGMRRVGFVMETYDPSVAVLVDPVLTYSTYLGGSGSDEGLDIAVDADGNAYVTGSTHGSFPTTTGSLQKTFGDVGGGGEDVFLTKINAAGTALVYSTYLGGDGDDMGRGVAVDASGEAWITGHTSGQFPTTTQPLQTALGGLHDAFITKLNAAGSALVYSTYLGGSEDDYGRAVAIDSSGNAYVTGSTQGGFPTTGGAYQTTYAGGFYDAFVAKLNAAGTALVYSSYLGGIGSDNCVGFAVDESGNAYITGQSIGGVFPTTNGAYQTTYSGPSATFVTKLNAAGTALVYSTYLESSISTAIAVDGSGNAYVAGISTADFLTTNGAFQTTFGGGQYDAFVTKLNAAGSALVYSTNLGGLGDDRGSGLAIDASGNAYVTGQAQESFPTTTGAYQTTYGGGFYDAFVTTLNAAGTALVYSTYLGGSGLDNVQGIAFDGRGNTYVTGQTDGSFVTTTGAFQTTFGGVQDVFVAQFSSPELANGILCTQAGQCGSGLCVDGLCCDTACADVCQACDVSGHVGTCTPVRGAPHGLRTACGSTTACTSTCDGTNTSACTYHPDVCASSCDSDTESSTLCDTTGACTVQKSRSCNNLVCGDAKACKARCVSNSDCVAGFACATDGTCQPSGTCLDDHRLQSADNGIKECSPYKCTAGACAVGCASVDDCVAPSVCDPSGKCVSPPSSSVGDGGDGGCSCEASSSSAPPLGTALATSVAAFLLAVLRRRALGRAADESDLDE